MISRLTFPAALKITANAKTVFRGDGTEDENEAVKSGHHSVNTYKDADVCLTCTREVCYGNEDCFQTRKKKMINGGP